MNRMRVWITALVLLSLPVSRAQSITLFAEDNEASYFMWTRYDLRMCPSPECGGFYVKALNRLWTLCADGSKTADCHVLQLDFSLLHMNEKEQTGFLQAFTDGRGIINGKLFQAQENGILFPTLIIYEAWLAQVGNEPGKDVFFQVHDTGIQCITTPCLTVDEGLLNLPGDRFIAGVDLTFNGAEAERINAGYQEMKTGFIIATGHHKIVQGPAGFSQILVASEFYLPVEKVETCGNTICPTGQTCCNPSCGICAPPGVACIQIACD
ncbi:MAG: hypothetical protein HY881_02350 [Deltaproteobacteria bacterium]|nr:hypothetical protein [Deltaproteobacteria bacterium]